MSDEANDTTETTTTQTAPDPGQWKTDLGDIGQDPSIVNYTSIAELAKGHIHQGKLVGKKGIETPNEGWDNEQWGSFWDAGGRPSEAAGYKTPEAPEGITLDEARMTAAKEKLYEFGASKKLGESLIDWHMQDLAGVQKSALEAQTASASEAAVVAKAVLDKGSTNPEKTVAEAELFVKNFGGDELAQEMRDGAMGKNPHLALAFSKAIQMINNATEEDTFGRMKMDVNALSSKGSAQSELDTMMQDPAKAKALARAEEPGHEALKARWQQLQKIIHGE